MRVSWQKYLKEFELSDYTDIDAHEDYRTMEINILSIFQRALVERRSLKELGSKRDGELILPDSIGPSTRVHENRPEGKWIVS